eukprot:m.3742 g.3742  ORF g.3742 m.3742 type:complete len:689 (+) comp2820_c0_seq2:158-2224(+)
MKMPIMHKWLRMFYVAAMIALLRCENVKNLEPYVPCLDYSLANQSISGSGSGIPLPTLFSCGFQNMCNCSSICMNCNNNSLQTASLGMLGTEEEVEGVQLLLLENNEITHIPAGILYNFRSSLEHLSFRNNVIEFVDPAAFKYLTTLLGLGLHGNKISWMSPDHFVPLKNLKNIGLDDNELTHLAPGLFAYNRHLSWVFISRNNIASMDVKIFTNATKLEYLDAGENLLTYVPEIRSPYMTSMLLANNNINNLTQVESVLGVLLEMEDESHEELPSVSFSNNPVTCELSTRTYHGSYVCTCAKPYQKSRKGLCVLPSSNLVEKLAISVVIGVLVGGLLVAGCFVVWKRFHALRHDLSLRERLLEDTSFELENAKAENLELQQGWEISPNDVNLQHRIDGGSEGAFGEVWLGNWENLPVAIKRLRLGLYEMDISTSIEFEREIDFLRKCRHRNIVRFFGFGTMESLPFLVTEYMSQGSLKVYLHENRNNVSWSHKKAFCLDIQAGMQHIHTLNRVHRDLKTANILLTNKLRAKIADFGSMKDILTKKLVPGGEDQQSVRERLSTISKTTSSGTTPLFMSPQTLKGAKHTQSDDVWSFAILLWEIAVEPQDSPDLAIYRQDLDWQGPYSQCLARAFFQGHRLPLIDIPDECAKIIGMCWDIVPGNRPSFAEIGDLLEETMLGDLDKDTAA